MKNSYTACNKKTNEEDVQYMRTKKNLGKVAENLMESVKPLSSNDKKGKYFINSNQTNNGRTKFQYVDKVFQCKKEFILKLYSENKISDATVEN